MRYQPDLLTYQHYLQRKKKYQKERNYGYCLFNQKGTNHLLQKGDILTCYEQNKGSCQNIKFYWGQDFI